MRLWSFKSILTLPIVNMTVGENHAGFITYDKSGLIRYAYSYKKSDLASTEQNHF